ncbi:MAG: patatin family protein [Coriobacteriales bacterium]|jgi:predicted patatin/cPLA2 family phospholipase|nr:patatin family protein [Coriobacteriales bacterium]
MKLNMAKTGSSTVGRHHKKFTVPKVYIPFDTPGYRPAWEGVEPIDCNLVLEGGAMRGQFTAGVLDFLMDNALLPRLAIGVSAGALNGLNYVAGLRGRSCYLNTKYCTDWRYLSMRSFTLTGNAFNVEYVFDRIPNELDPFDFEAYARSPLTLITVSSNLVAGEADYTMLRDARTQLDYLRASSSMPLLSKIVKVDGKELLDGGVCDSVPIDYSKATGSPKHIVVLTQHAEYEKKANEFMPLVRRLYAKYPLFIERMERRHLDYNKVYRRVARMHEEGEIFVIRPPERVTLASMEHDPEKLYRLWETGYAEAQKNFAALWRYLES